MDAGGGTASSWLEAIKKGEEKQARKTETSAHHFVLIRSSSFPSPFANNKWEVPGAYGSPKEVKDELAPHQGPVLALTPAVPVVFCLNCSNTVVKARQGHTTTISPTGWALSASRASQSWAGPVEERDGKTVKDGPAWRLTLADCFVPATTPEVLSAATRRGLRGGAMVQWCSGAMDRELRERCLIGSTIGRAKRGRMYCTVVYCTVRDEDRSHSVRSRVRGFRA